VPDILVNNAGIGIAGRLDHVPRDHWETLMQLNLMAPMRLCSELLPGMIERGSGHIVNISSIAGWTVYCRLDGGRGLVLVLCVEVRAARLRYLAGGRPGEYRRPGDQRVSVLQPDAYSRLTAAWLRGAPDSA
jgi:NAD(P)-dependent dehydrogenase (short-subunit alcohol dehydrogenase family)